MDWSLILSGVLIVAMLIFVAPRAIQMARNSPKGSSADWMGAALPLIGVVVFVLLLMSMV